MVSDMCAAHDRKRPVVNARKARCQNFVSNFMGSRSEAGFVVQEGGTARTIEVGRRNLVHGHGTRDGAQRPIVILRSEATKDLHSSREGADSSLRSE